MNTLLEEAKKYSKLPRTFSDDEIELAIAYVMGEVTTSAVAKALNTSYFNIRAWLATRLQEAARKGLIKRT